MECLRCVSERERGFSAGMLAGVRMCLRVAGLLGMSADMRERIVAVFRKAADAG